MQAFRFLRLAVITHPTLFGGLRVDVGHVLLTAFSIFVGAIVGFIQSQPTATLLGALSSWSTAKPLLFSALVAGLGAVLAQAKQSFLLPSTGGGGGGNAVDVPPAPPALTVVAFCLLLPSCGSPQQKTVVANALEAEAACVENEVYNLHETNAVAVITACGPEEGAAILSLLDAIFVSPSKSAGVPPAQLASLRASAHAAGASGKYISPAPTPAP